MTKTSYYVNYYHNTGWIYPVYFDDNCKMSAFLTSNIFPYKHLFATKTIGADLPKVPPFLIKIYILPFVLLYEQHLVLPYISSRLLLTKLHLQ